MFRAILIAALTEFAYPVCLKVLCFEEPEFEPYMFSLNVLHEFEHFVVKPKGKT